MISIDYFLFEKINNLAGKNACFDSLAIFFADYFQYLVIFLAIIIFWKNWRFYFQSVLAIILSRLVLVELIRFLYQRPRPFVSHQVHQLLVHDSFSFPSGHAAVFFVLAMIVFLYPSTSLGTSNKKAGWYFFAVAFLISLARVFAGIHYPFDILAGAIVGIVSGWLVNKFFSKKFL